MIEFFLFQNKLFIYHSFQKKLSNHSGDVFSQSKIIETDLTESFLFRVYLQIKLCQSKGKFKVRLLHQNLNHLQSHRSFLFHRLESFHYPEYFLL